MNKKLQIRTQKEKKKQNMHIKSNLHRTKYIHIQSTGKVASLWLLKSIGNNLKGRLCFMHANYCNMFIVFHENRTILKLEGNEVEETITTINFFKFIIKFKIPVY